MKRVFTFTSTILLTIFLVFSMTAKRDSIEFISYPFVTIESENLDITHKEVKNTLNELAQKHHSLIGRRIIRIKNQHDHQFVYELYGNLKAPKSIKKANREESTKGILANSYVILKGPISKETLKKTLNELGFEASSNEKLSSFFIASQIFSNSTVFITMLISVLTLLSLMLISNIQSMRNISIKLVNGRSIKFLVWELIRDDLLNVCLANIVSFLIGFILLYMFDMNYGSFLRVLIAGMLIFAIIIISMSLLMNILFLFNYRNKNLINIMKGNLPVTSLFIFFIIGQMIAYLLMSFNVMTIQSALEDYHQLSVSNERWHREPNWVTFKYNINAISGQGQERFNRQKMWYELGRDLIEKDKGLYIKNVSTQEYFEENLLDEKGKHSPMPDNLLFVSPNYLIEENIHIDNQLKDSFNQLKPGKYGLILPQKYKSSQKELIHKLKDRFRAYTREGYSSESRLAYEPQFQVSFIENDQRRFTFQSGMGKASKTPQFVEDPAIIILTPNNFGDTPATISSWAGELSRYLLLPSYEIFENRLEEYELKPYIANIENAQKTYFNNVNKYMQELIQTFLGTCLGVFTSFLLFNAMNILYFEHFRKENFIKRLDGQSFIQRHSSYLWVQLIALVSISIVSQLLGHSIWMSISVLLVFIINQWLSLMIQTRKENKISLTILKGK